MSKPLASREIFKLTSVAEELIKAAEEVINAPSVHIYDVTSTSLESKMDLLNQKLSSLTTNTTDRLSELSNQLEKINKNIDVQNESIAIQNQNIVFQTKHQRLDSAFANLQRGKFNYFDKRDHYQKYSTELVEAILLSFRKGMGWNITHLAVYNGKEAEAEFRAKIVEHLFTLLGTKPRLVFKDEKWSIYYE